MKTSLYKRNHHEKKEENMKKYAGLFVVGLVVLGLAGVGVAQTTAQHNVTVDVQAITCIAMTGGGDLTINITTATPGSEPDAVQNSTRGLQWTTNETAQKVTVAADVAYSTYTLKALATGIVGGGSAAAEVTFNDANDHDFVTGVATEVGSCTIRYTASATAAAGVGSEQHQITYTITDAT